MSIHCSPAQMYSLGSIYYPSHHSPTLKWQHRAGFEFSLDWCKIVLRLPSHRFFSMTHSSYAAYQQHPPLLLCDSLLSAFWGYNPRYYTWIAAASTDLLRGQPTMELLYSKVTCKAFQISATASLVWVFLQPSNNSARHIMLIFFCKFANRSWQYIPSPTVTHKTLYFMKNDTANATWDGRLQTELHPR